MDFDQIKDILSDVITNVSEKGKEVAIAAKDKTVTASRIARLSVELSTEKDSLKKAYLELGKAYYKECRGSAIGVFAQLCEELDAIHGRMDVISAEIAALKTEFASCKTKEDREDFEDVVEKDEACCPEVTPEDCVCAEGPAEDCGCPVEIPVNPQEPDADCCADEEAPEEKTEAPADSCGCAEGTEADCGCTPDITVEIVEDGGPEPSTEE